MSACVRRFEKNWLQCLLLWLILGILSLSRCFAKDVPIEIVPYSPHGVSGIIDVAISGDGSKGFSLDRQLTLKIWDIPSGRLIRTIDSPKDSYSSEDSEEYPRLTVSHDGSRATWIFFQSDPQSTSPAVHEILVNTETGRTIKIFDADPDQSSDDIYHASTLPVLTRDYLASVSSAGQLSLYDRDSGAPLRTVTLQQPAKLLAHSKKRDLILISNGGSVETWDIQQLKPEASVSLNTSTIKAVQLLDDDRLVLIQSGDLKVSLRETKTLTSYRLYDFVWTMPDHEILKQKFFYGPDGLQSALKEQKKEKPRNFEDKSPTQEINIRHLRLINYDLKQAIELDRSDKFYSEEFYFSDDGSNLLSSGIDEDAPGKNTTCKINVWSTKTGSLTSVASSVTSRIDPWVCELLISISPRSNVYLAGKVSAPDVAYQHDDQVLALYDLHSGAIRYDFSQHVGSVTSLSVTQDGSLLVSGTYNGFLNLWDLTAGELKRSVKISASPVSCVAISPDGRQIASGSFQDLKLWDLASGKLVREFHLDLWSEAFSSAAGMVNCNVVFSRNGEIIAWGGVLGPEVRQDYGGYAVILFDTVRGELLPSSKIHASSYAPEKLRSKLNEYAELGLDHENTDGERVNLFFTSDGRQLITGYGQSIVFWDIRTGRMDRKIQTDLYIWNLAVSKDQKYLAVDGWQAGRVEVLSSDNGRILHSLMLPDEKHNNLGLAFSGTQGGNLAWITRELVFNEFNIGTAKTSKRTLCADAASTVALSASLQQVAVGAADGSIKYCDNGTGLPLTLVAGMGGEWLALTPGGFFRGSGAGAGNLLSVVRGLKVYAVEQFFRALYNPELVEAVRKGDPEGKYRNAAYKLDLEKVLGSGPVPQIEFLRDKTERAGDSVRLTVRTTDAGGGIGPRIEWRVKSQASGKPQTQGRISPPELHGLTEFSAGRSATVTESLRIDPSHQNIIEVTAYNGREVIATSPLRITIDAFGATEKERPRLYVLSIGVDKYRMAGYELHYAVKDAESFAKAIASAGSELFTVMPPTVLRNDQVTIPAIEAAFDRIAAEAKPSDVFVLYLGGHGTSVEGVYYYYPETLDFGHGGSYKTGAISLDQWQVWLAKVGHVEKNLLVIDTCESAGFIFRRGKDTERQTAMDQLEHATGKNLIAASRVAAFEGYRGHGVLTYTLLEALNKGNRGAGDIVRITDLANHVGQAVPALTQSLFGDRQNPYLDLSGNDFPIGYRKTVLAREEDRPQGPSIYTHVLIRQETVREAPKQDAQAERDVGPGFQVRVLKFVGDWALIAREGQPLGYVRAAALTRLQ